jgi:membrane protein
VEERLEHLPRPLGKIVGASREEDIFFLSAGLAFYALVSVAPSIVLAFWLTSVIIGDDAVHRTAEDLARLAPRKLGVDKAFERAAEAGAELGLWAVLGTLWPATAYGAGLVRAFDRLSRQSRELPGLRGRGLALLLVGSIQVVALAGLGLAAVGPRLLGRGGVATALGWALGVAAGFLTLATMTALIYRFFAAEAVGWGAILRGASMVAGGVSVLSAGYAVFLQLGADFEERYASSGLAAVVLLAVWLFLANALLLLGYRLTRHD